MPPAASATAFFTSARFQKDWFSRKEAALYLASIGCPVPLRTLEKWAMNNNAGKGPPFTRIKSKIVRYRRADLDAWAYREVTVVG